MKRLVWVTDIHLNFIVKTGGAEYGSPGLQEMVIAQ